MPLIVRLLVIMLLCLDAGIADDQVDEFWVVSLGPTSAERTLEATLQGLVNAKRFRLWIRSTGLAAHVYDEIAAGAKVHELGSVWDALTVFRADVAGMVVFTAKTQSLNTATALCGPLQAVAVEESLLTRAAAAGLTSLADARTLEPMAVWERYKDRFSHGILVEQDPAKEWQLRDFAVARTAFVFWHLPDQDVQRLLRDSGPGTIIYGWGSDEKHAVTLASAGGGACIASDWSVDLSALSQLPVAIPPRPLPPAPAGAKPRERIVAFVMSDGDNLCFVGGTFADDQAYYASPYRGAFNMTWEMAPRMAELDSRGLRWFYHAASHGPTYDDFVIGPSGDAYSFPSHQPDRAAAAHRTALWAQRSGMDIVSVLNDGGGMEQADELLDQSGIAGVLYKDWAPYNARHGAVHWHAGKPCIAYRYLLWEGLPGQDPASVAAAIATLSSDPAHDADSYALINVHAWSWRSIGGPMEAVHRTIGLLPPGTRVVTAHELIELMTRQLAPQAR